MHRLFALGAAVAVFAGCGEADVPEASGAPNGEPAASALPVGLVEELRIGGIDGDVEYTFGSVSAVAPAPDGSVYVADRQGPVVRRYGSDGRHIVDVGSDGQGPGEYTSVDGLGVSADGTLMLYDGRNARLSRFSPDGEFVGSVQVPNGAGGFRALAYSRSGDAFVRVYPEAGPPETPDGEMLMDWARIDADGTQDRLATAPPERREGPRFVVSGHGGYYRPFVTMTLSALGPDGSFYEVRNDEYRITHTRRDGSVTEIVRDEEPIEVTSDEERQWEAFSESAAGRPGADRSDFFPIPSTKPFIRELLVDLDGRLWVSRYTEAVFMEYSDWERDDRRENDRPPHQWRDLSSWDVFDSHDRYLGSVTFPFKTTLMTASGDDVWGIHGGEYNEAYIVRWRLDLAASDGS